MYEFELWTWRTWFYNKFELSNFWKEIKLQTNYKQIFWHSFSNLFVNCIVLGYSSLNISSTIRDLKLKGMPKYKQLWACYKYIFAPYIWLTHNYMNFWFRNISSAKLKWKECTRRITHDCFFSVIWLTQVGYFILNFPWLIFLVVFLPITAICLVSLKNHKIVMSLTFAL